MAKERKRKLTVMVPEELIQKATRVTKTGVTATVRSALELVAAHDVYDRLLRMRGKVKFGLTWQEMRGEE